MPIKLVPPTTGRNKVYRVRGTYLGRYVDRSTQTSEIAKAKRFLKAIEAKIERGEFSSREELTFAASALSYMQAGGDKRFLAPIIAHFGNTPAKHIDQAEIDAAAAKLHPGNPATRNRQVYTPISAVLRHAGITLAISRPKGAQGTPRSIWLRPEAFEALARTALADDVEFGILIVLLCYTGLRLSEALRLRCEDIDLANAEAICSHTKNGQPRLAYLPPRVIAALANHPLGLDRKGRRVFRWSKSGELYLLAERIYGLAGIDHGGAPFHVLRHTYGAWMTRAKADLISTGAWRSAAAARVYQHHELSEEARKADLLPGATRATIVQD
jgi:integrase